MGVCCQKLEDPEEEVFMGNRGDMKITVLGLWHLGSVTAACCAQHFRVVGLDYNAGIVRDLAAGKAPLFEPGLDDLLAEGLTKGSLSFTEDASAACAGADVLWVCADTPVNEQDISDVAAVLVPLRKTLPHLMPGTLVLVSSQLPVGTCAKLEAEFPAFQFACCPENLRLGGAIKVFTDADRYVLGIRSEQPRPLLEKLFAPFTQQLLFMRPESAEMVKHALNSFLAASITFINEIATVCEWVGADAKEVSAGLKSDIRIGPKAYLGPGGPFAGGTLARDVVTLTGIGESRGETLELIPAIKRSNDNHRGWARRRLLAHFKDLAGRRISLIGLTYKAGTDTLRRSAAVELGQALAAAGAHVRSWDPVVKELPPGLEALGLVHSLEEAAEDAEVMVVGTEWPVLLDADWEQILPRMRTPVLVDANRFLERRLGGQPGVKILSVGRI